MKKKILSLVLVMATAMTMVRGASVTSFAAAATANITVNIYVPVGDEAVVIGGNIEVDEYISEAWGYFEEVPAGNVTALDVLIACEMAIMGNPYGITVNSGETDRAYIRHAFGLDDWDFAVNGVYDNTGTRDGYSDVSTTIVKDGYVVTFFLDEDSILVDVSYLGASLGQLGGKINGTAETSITIPVASTYAVNCYYLADGPVDDSVVPEFYLTQPVETGQIDGSITIASVSDFANKYYNMEEVDESIATVETNADGDAEIFAADYDAAGHMVPVEITFDIAEKEEVAPVKDDTAKTGDSTVAFGAMIALLIAAGTAAVALKRKED